MKSRRAGERAPRPGARAGTAVPHARPAAVGRLPRTPIARREALARPVARARTSGRTDDPAPSRPTHACARPTERPAAVHLRGTTCSAAAPRVARRSRPMCPSSRVRSRVHSPHPSQPREPARPARLAPAGRTALRRDAHSERIPPPSAAARPPGQPPKTSRSPQPGHPGSRGTWQRSGHSGRARPRTGCGMDPREKRSDSSGIECS